MLDFVYISSPRWLIPFSSSRRKSIGRIMMLLSVLPPRLYVHCHQFKQTLDLKPGFYSFSLIYLQPLLVYGDMCVVCGL